MKRKIIFGIRGLLLAVFCFGMIGFPVSATRGELEDVRENIEELEQEQEESTRELADLEENIACLEGRLAELNDELSTLSQELTYLHGQQEETKRELIAVQGELEVAKEKETEQYAAMKKRIRFLYERGNNTLLETLLETKSFADFMNFAEYVESIHTYDRHMLSEYTELKEEIVAKEERILEEQNSLLAMEAEQKDKMTRIESLLAEVRAGVGNTEDQIAQTRDEIADTEDQLARQRALEDELEEQLANEDANRIDEIEDQEDENTGPPYISNSEDEVAMLAALIECEAGGESYEGKLAVGSVVINRIRSSYFPNTLVEVIYQPRQFSPVASGRFATVLSRGANATCVQAARENLSGTITIDALYFRRNNGTIKGTVIGNHVFY